MTDPIALARSSTTPLLYGTPGNGSGPHLAVELLAKEAKIRLQHVDLYRLKPEEVDDLGLEDLLEGSVMAVEWPDRWHRAPADARVVTLELAGGDRRKVTVQSANSQLEA